MKTHVVARINISADTAAVFKYLVNLKYHYLWNPHLQTISPLKSLKPKMSYKSTSILLGVKISGVNEVTKLLPNKELELENTTGVLKYHVNYRLRTDKDKTQLKCTTTVYSDGHGFAFAQPVLKLLARRELQSDLKALKIAVEQKLG